MQTKKLLTFTKKGIYCEQADVYIDPSRIVDKALITHAHSDHARPGCKKYLATPLTKAILHHRLGQKYEIQAINFGERININGVNISFHPAGHIIGSAQIRLEYKGEIWVASGDYKVENDGLTEPFEPVRCHHFITESTFALPIYNWAPQIAVQQEINDWWAQNAQAENVCLMSAYSLGKAQRIASILDPSIGPIIVHKAIHQIHEKYRSMGVTIPIYPVLGDTRTGDIEPGTMIISPTSSLEVDWSQKVNILLKGSASGWMAARRIRKRRSVDRGFVLSDHADWKGLLWAIEQTGAEHIYVTHGYTKLFARYLNEKGWNAMIVGSELKRDEEIL